MSTTASRPDPADLEAVRRVSAVEPVWTGMTSVAAVIGDHKVLLHAGPPFAGWADVPPPVRNSLTFAAVHEGWAEDVQQAEQLIVEGVVALAPAQDHDIVVPLAGVASASMGLHVVEDSRGPGRKYAVINEGMQHMTRVGRRDVGLGDHHRWLNGPFRAWLEGLLDEPVALLPLLERSLRDGDDGHSRTSAGSAALTRLLRERADAADDPAFLAFLDGAPALALNLWMAAAALRLAAAEGVSDSTLVTRAGGNGHRFGIQVAARPGQWLTVPATPPVGGMDPGHEGAHATGALGDSAVVDFLGYGGMSLADAPDVRAAMADYLPKDALSRRQRLQEHAGGADAGDRIGVTVQAVLDEGVTPIVLLGMIDATGADGRLGGGVYQPPLELFQQGRKVVASGRPSPSPVVPVSPAVPPSL